jgi:hypothetical protein
MGASKGFATQLFELFQRMEMMCFLRELDDLVTDVHDREISSQARGIVYIT